MRTSDAVVRLGHGDVRRDDLPGQDPPLARLQPAKNAASPRTKRKRKASGAGASPGSRASARARTFSHTVRPPTKAVDSTPRSPRAQPKRGTAPGPSGGSPSAHHPQHRVLDRGVRHVAAQREQQVAVPAVGGVEAGAVETVPARRGERRHPDAAGPDPHHGRLRSRRRPSPPTAPRRRGRRARPAAGPPPPRERARAASASPRPCGGARGTTRRAPRARPARRAASSGSASKSAHTASSARTGTRWAGCRRAARESIDSTPRKASRTVGEAGQARSWR